MIPSIESIVKGLLDGSYTAEQAIGWLHDHAAPPDEDRLMVAALMMQPIVNGNYSPRFVEVENNAPDAVKIADALIAALKAAP